MYESQGFKTVVFERNVPTRYSKPHMHLQVIPVNSTASDMVASSFKEAFENGNYLYKDMKKCLTDSIIELKSSDESLEAYFAVQLPDNSTLVHRVNPDQKFPLQFGRYVVCNMLGTPEKINWKNCQVDKDEETNMANRFKKSFTSFDHTLV